MVYETTTQATYRENREYNTSTTKKNISIVPKEINYSIDVDTNSIEVGDICTVTIRAFEKNNDDKKIKIGYVVLYFENPQQAFDELKQAMKSATPVLVDKTATGPIKRLCVISNQIKGLAMQDEQYQ